MGLPPRKFTRSRTLLKRSHARLAAPNIPRSQKIRPAGTRSGRFFCTNCNQPKPPHAVCPNCGYYRGRAVIEIER
jgi:large subunit ribosomal protein L32